MAKENRATLRIEWVRSGIAFNRSQKEIVRSLGLRRLHQVIERPDNPVVRGLVAKVSHLVEVREESKPSAWAAVPEYTITAPEPALQAVSQGEETQPTVAETSSDAIPEATAERTTEPESEEPVSASEQAGYTDAEDS
jgi:large subunit ribosomal protein L30